MSTTNERLDALWGHLHAERQDVLRGMVWYFEDEAPCEDTDETRLAVVLAARISPEEVEQGLATLDDPKGHLHRYDTVVVFDETTHTTHVRVEYA